MVTETPSLVVNFFGPLEVVRDGEVQTLPQSKKTRALLAYLAITGRSHRRERLCQLLWDVADDPRGALRWSLSKIRKSVDGSTRRVVADRESVELVAGDASIDVLRLSAATSAGLERLDTDTLESLALEYRGELLQGLELTDFHEFHAWCVSEREEARRKHVAVLAELVTRLAGDPERALPFARRWVHADEFSVASRVALLHILLQSGRSAEARQQLEIGERVLADLGSGVGELRAAWAELTTSVNAEPEALPAHRAAEPAAPGASGPTLPAAGLVGRSEEIGTLHRLVDLVRSSKNERVLLIQGEPGSGKSRLLEYLLPTLHERQFEIFTAKCFEAESSRPYGPWVDALAGRVAEDFFEAEQQSSRDILFSAVTDVVASGAARGGGAAIILDDIQWLDRDSSALLHFVARMSRQRPVLLVLLSRNGELSDNEAALQTLRGIRRELPVEDLHLEPMSPAEIAELVAPMGGNADAIYEACAGNPLYALELAQSEAWATSSPRTLVDLVRERVDRLPADASELLRWAATLGYAFDVQRLEALTSLSIDALVEALESLESHRLIRVDGEAGGSRYRFAHDIVRESIYGELSLPRRRLMHQKIASLLEPSMSDPRIATQVAHHATLAGNATLGIRACIAAGRHSLRVFANGDAEDLANKGLHLAESLHGPSRVEVEIELIQIRVAARVTDVEAAVARIRALTDQALDYGLPHASRLGFHMLSFLRWDHGAVADAHRHMMDAERISRSADPVVRAEALAEAARCLVLLERNLEQAEAFAIEAQTLAERNAHPVKGVPFVVGMLERHRGNTDRAIEAYREARRLARESGDRLSEFSALEHEVMLELDRNNPRRALEIAAELAELGTKVRPGSEALAGRGLHQLAIAMVEEGQWSPLDDTLEQLRIMDAKYRHSYLLTRMASALAERGQGEKAKVLAEKGLDAATAINRASEIALARLVLGRLAEDRGDSEITRAQAESLRELDLRYVGAEIRDRVSSFLDEQQSGDGGGGASV